MITVKTLQKLRDIYEKDMEEEKFECMIRIIQKFDLKYKSIDE